MKNPFVYIKWNDAALLTGYHKNTDKNLGLSEMETVGVLIADKEEHIEVALTATDQKDEFGEILSIPKSQILEMYTLIKSTNYLSLSNPKEILVDYHKFVLRDYHNLSVN